MKKLVLSKKLKDEIRNHACYSLYRFNASSADCYAFNVIVNDKGKVDFEGGWDWANNLVDKEADYLYLLTNGKFIKLK